MNSIEICIFYTFINTKFPPAWEFEQLYILNIRNVSTARGYVTSGHLIPSLYICIFSLFIWSSQLLPGTSRNSSFATGPRQKQKSFVCPHPPHKRRRKLDNKNKSLLASVYVFQFLPLTSPRYTSIFSVSFLFYPTFLKTYDIILASVYPYVSIYLYITPLYLSEGLWSRLAVFVSLQIFEAYEITLLSV